MEIILEQASEPNNDFRVRIRNAKTFADIASLFEDFFNLKIPSAIDNHKKPDSDFGLQKASKEKREKLNAQCREILARVKKPEDLTPEERRQARNLRASALRARLMTSR